MENEQIQQASINRAVWAACDTFRGTLDAGDYKDYVLTMLFLKYLSDVWQDSYDKYAEEYADAPEMIELMLDTERFKLPASAHFKVLYEQRHLEGNGERIDKALHAIEEANITKLADVFRDISFNSNKLGEEKQKNELLRHLLEDFNKPELNLRPSRVGQLDIIGNAYEYLIKNFAESAGKKAGEFYTPPEVSLLMAKLMEPQPGDEICDPTCGSASLLLKCANEVRANFDGSKNFALFGQESIGSTWALAKMNMFLNWMDNHQLEWGDTIRNPKLLSSNGQLRHFDVVVANPPFSLDKWGHDKAEEDEHSRFRRGVPPRTKGDYAFILHMIETMKPTTGRMAVVVPHGVLFRGSSEGKIRQKLIEENLLEAVIGLPEKLFYGTGIPAAILVFRRKKIDRSVLFIDASREFDSNKSQNALGAEHIQKIVETYQAYRARQKSLGKPGDSSVGAHVLADKYAYIASFDEIQENDFNLNIPRYVDTFEEEEPIDVMAVRKERKKLQAELQALEVEMAGFLKELGYE